MKPNNSKHLVAAGQIFHLVSQETQGKPLCGAASSTALIGSYGEHLDTAGDEVRWVREVFGPGGKPVRACERCLDAYPSELKRITPFTVNVSVQFEPDQKFNGYNLTATATAQVGDKHEAVKAYPLSTFLTANRLHYLQFEVAILADPIIPWVQKANRE